MKRRPLSGLPRYLFLSFPLISMALLLFGCGKGDTGPAGPAGPPGTSSGTVQGTVRTSLSGNPVAGVAVTTSPSVQGVTNITTDANGFYSVSLPNGNYTLTFTKNNYTPQTTGTIAVVATQTTTRDISLVPLGAAVVNAGADKTGQALGSSIPLSATLEVFDPSLAGQPVTYSWTQTSGPTATISSGNTATPTVTLASRSAFKADLVLKNAVRYGAEPPAGGSGPDIPTMVVLNRFMVVPITPLSLEESGTSAFKVTATIGSQSFTDQVNVSVTLPFGPATGIRNVPIGQPVLLQGKNQAAYNWSMAGPAGSAATLNDATSQNPDFIPDISGKYTLTETTSATSLDLYAGTWVGVVVADGNPGVTPDSACLGCHNGTTAPDKFTPWKDSGHAFILKQNIDDPAGHWSVTGCGPCHTVGYNQVATAILNNGWDQVAKAEGFKFTQNPNAWAQTLANYPKTAQLSNIQCENCHGPQAGGGAHTLESPRIDIAGSLCGVCHGEPLRHARFQQWAESGHGDYETAVEEGFSTSGAGVTTIRTSCAGCHTGQGFLQWYKQIANVGGGRGVGSRTLDATTLANLGWNSTGTLTSAGAQVIQDAAVPGVVTKANVHPQTCAVCHDPHAEGTTSGEPNTATVRVSGNTSLLPGGFLANGVGRGAQCITCHNSRNGERTSGGGNPTLHEDGDINFGTNTGYTVVAAGLPNAGEHAAYNAPHEAAQGDVLMGRNAYFVTGQRSRHSFLADTCATCHMEATPPPPELSYNLSGTNHSFTASKTICSQCHGAYDGGTIQSAFDTSLAQLATEITNAVYKLKNGGAATPPATFVLYFGRSFQYSLDGGTTKANVGSSYDSTTGARTDGYLTGVTAGGTDPNEGYNAVIAKANWNYSLASLDSSRGIHNPSFTVSVLDQTRAQVRALAAGLP
jgi:Carboxypeptidase regulatory-like domain